MSHSESKSEVQIAPPTQAFSFLTISNPHRPTITPFCRFSIPERVPLKPFRQDRLTRLPLPTSITETSRMTSNTGVSNSDSVKKTEKRSDVDPYQKIQQLEKNIAFIKEDHARLLKSLHEEVADLKQKNRELLFEVVTGISIQSKESSDASFDEKSTPPDEQTERVDILEKEVKKLKSALKNAMKNNAALSFQLQELKQDSYPKSSSNKKEHVQVQWDPDGGRRSHSPSGPSPQMEEYSDTLKQIQRAASHRSCKGRHYYQNEYRNNWAEGYHKGGNECYQRLRRHYMNKYTPKSPPEQRHDSRFPRLPLHNQQNHQSRPQYEAPYRQRSSNTLPALVPVVGPSIDKSKKSREERQSFADQVTNG